MAIEEESSVREIEFDVKHVSLENLLSPVTFLLFFVVLVSLFNVQSYPEYMKKTKRKEKACEHRSVSKCAIRTRTGNLAQSDEH